jgi:molybdenum cofactor biosynthesis enzyme MoaA
MTELGGRVLLLRSWLTRLVDPPPVQQDPRSQWTQIRDDLGVSKVRLAGGEPLQRRDLEVLCPRRVDTGEQRRRADDQRLAARRPCAEPARRGLHRVTVSLDSLDPTVFAAMGDTKLPLSKVLDGIAAAADAGLAPIKLNTVLRRGMNEAGALDLVEFARDGGHVPRCIEYMDVGSTNGWDRSEVVTSAEVLDRIAAHPVEPVAAARPGEVAERWRYLDGRGEFGLISSVSTPFCSTCTRASLTAVGELYTCLFAARGRDLPPAPRWGRRRRAACCDRRCLGRSGRPLLRAAWPKHRGPPEARDVLPRRLIPGFGADAGQDCDSASQSIFADSARRLPTRRPRRRTPWRERPAAGTDCRLLGRSFERNPTERSMLDVGPVPLSRGLDQGAAPESLVSEVAPPPPVRNPRNFGCTPFPPG